MISVGKHTMVGSSNHIQSKWMKGKIIQPGFASGFFTNQYDGENHGFLFRLSQQNRLRQR
jgi:hypothetical protein